MGCGKQRVHKNFFVFSFSIQAHANRLLTFDDSVGIVPAEPVVGGVQLVPGVGLVDLEVLVVIVALVLVRVHPHLVGVGGEGDRRVEPHLPVLLVVDGAYLEPVLVPADEAGLLPSVAGGAGAHDGGLGEDA